MQYDQQVFKNHPYIFHSVVYSNRAELRVILQIIQAETPLIQVQPRSTTVQVLTHAAIRAICQIEICPISKHCANSSSGARTEVPQYADLLLQPVNRYINRGILQTIGLN